MGRDELVELSLELLAPAGPARALRMFGAHGLYVGELFVAIVAAGRLYLKADETTQADFAAAGGEPFVHAARGRLVRLNFWTPPADAMESPAQMLPWARRALQSALAARAVGARPRTRGAAKARIRRPSPP